MNIEIKINHIRHIEHIEKRISPQNYVFYVSMW